MLNNILRKANLINIHRLLWTTSLIALFLSLPATASWRLAEHLPDSAQLYLRIPDPARIYQPNPQSPLGRLNGDHSFQKQNNDLLIAFREKMLTPLADLNALPLSPLLAYADGPIEAALLLPENSPPMLANLLVNIPLEVNSSLDLNALLNDLVTTNPDIVLQQLFTPEHPAQLNIGGFPFYLAIDSKQNRLAILSGLAAVPELIEEMSRFAKISPQHPSLEISRQIDSSGEGFLLWGNLQSALPLISLNFPPEELVQLQQWGVMGVKQFGMGYGVADKKGHLKLILGYQPEGLIGMIPLKERRLNVSSRGDPGMLFSLAIPTEEGVLGLEKLLESYDPQLYEAYKEIDHELATSMQLTMAQFASIFAGELLLFSDDLGFFAALKQGNPERQKQLLNHLSQQGLVQYRQRQIEDKTYHHLSTPTMGADLQAYIETLEPESSEAQLFSTLQRVTNEFYWIEEVGYLIFAQVPQLLMERQRHKDRVDIGKWLQDRQRQQGKDALFLFSTRLDGVTHHYYHAYLGMLQQLGNIVETPIDLFTLPTAQQLQLPNQGAVGVQLDLSSQQLSLDISFEESIAELMMHPATAMTGIALIGVTTAIAIPAYSDYQDQMNTSEEMLIEEDLTVATVDEVIYKGFQILVDIQQQAETLRQSQGVMPSLEELQISFDKDAFQLEMRPELPGYTLGFSDARVEGYLMIFKDQESGYWYCRGEGVNPDHLPEICHE